MKIRKGERLQIVLSLLFVVGLVVWFCFSITSQRKLAYERGKEAAAEGALSSSNPYVGRNEWLRGPWEKGFKEIREGEKK